MYTTISEKGDILTIPVKCYQNRSRCEHLGVKLNDEHVSFYTSDEIYKWCEENKAPLPPHFNFIPIAIQNFTNQLNDNTILTDGTDTLIVYTSCIETFPCTHDVILNGVQKTMKSTEIRNFCKKHNLEYPQHFKNKIV